MTLKSGTYTITSKAENAYVGRSHREDRSFNPKRVVFLPQDSDAPKWEIEAVPTGNFIMKIGGGHAAEIDKRLFAILQEEPKPVTWKIEAQPHMGENTYTINLADRPSAGGWMVLVNNEEGDNQIAVQHYIIGPSFPPFDPPVLLFVIVPA
ncbi:hypothetical protein HYPSUDRAFT_217850 [Hypholoma sublateritium FD-334 SS-4]|uniref:Uncharacterized protein n=1 Tax=Hypholoma sublateritium (strain FD-334 SS-4) TaxID=945553 RepID=A0A0D2M6Y7_HYPSF|nr:hypothetical protein HYPSUDRAFT_217850 [Hypholoma sublateritium FD-334 SS-4]